MATAIDEGPDVSEHDRRHELRKEAFTMALYVAICLLAALAAVSDHSTDEIVVLEIIWGTTMGLALAHWFAFTVATRLASTDGVHRNDAGVIGAELVGAASVAIAVTIPVVLFPESVRLEIARVVLALFVGMIGFVVARSGGASRGRSMAYAGVVLVAAAVVVVLKNWLLGH